MPIDRSAPDDDSHELPAASTGRRLRDRLVDIVVRHRARPRLYATPFDRYRVRVARSARDHRHAFQLVQVAYAWLGIENVAGPTMRMTPQHVLPESTIFVARDEHERLVGTMTVTLDSPAGLPLEHDYGAELAALRRGGDRLAEYGSLAVVQRCKHTGVSTLLSMAATWFAQRYLQASHVVIGVHPAATRLYRALFNFAPLGAPRPHASLVAPVQGLVQDLTTFGPFLRRHFAGPTASGLPLAAHFFDELPACIEMPPPGDLASLARWKLPRSVFRELFIDGSDRVRTLDSRTRNQLGCWRSIRTTSPGSQEEALR